MRMTAHVQKTVNKAHGIINAMISLTPKIGGPGAAKKSPLASTVQSVVLYGAKAWQKTLRYKTLLDRVNRRLAICITAAYRTISTQMAQVLAGLPPLDLMVEERSSIQEDGKASRKLHRSTLTRKWTDRWGDYEGWAKVFITDLNVCLQEERFQDVNHFVTQAISGHGAFGSYLKTIRKQESDQCWFCEDSDTPYHTIFVGRQFEFIRAEAADRCGKRITKDAMGTILATKDGWDVIRPIIQDIMKTKCYLERRMQSPWQ
uniref:Reverse transcriptase domain-containing protein n=1 Tax=Dendroctonus ponderosae TaxID=77166 RepID=A0AAR5QDL0_DENPD